MIFNWFVIPFVVGLIFIILYVVGRFTQWTMKLSVSDKKLFRKNFFSRRIFGVFKEIFLESLLHRKIFKTNILLGFMHMSFAFGWFLLIFVGTIESKVHEAHAFNAPYNPIFFQFFVHDYSHFKYAALFTNMMDAILLVLLFAIVLALAKRIYKSMYGMKKTTKQSSVDRFALTILWLIFPLRFFAESFTAGIYNNGGFLTQTAGDIFAQFLPLESLELSAWWAYSLSLFAFFMVLPFSRYMHIPTELLLIAMKRSGLKEKKEFDAVSDVAVHSCSRCGICINSCQLDSSVNLKTIAPAYFLRTMREENIDVNAAEYCMMCGRCSEACPVGIESTLIRLSKKHEIRETIDSKLDYLPVLAVENAKVAYYTGCAGHLTPNVYRSMLKIFEKAEINYSFIDKEQGICCGRPLLLSGDYVGAEMMKEKNVEMILSSNAEILVTSCPICLNAFKNEYNLSIPVVHHSEYLNSLINSGKLKVTKSEIKTFYHDSCELARGNSITMEPRTVLNSVSNLVNTSYDKANALCCGGSLGTTKLDNKEKTAIATDSLNVFTKKDYELLVTACPVCKKTFNSTSSTVVKDIAEIVAENL